MKFSMAVCLGLTTFPQGIEQIPTIRVSPLIKIFMSKMEKFRVPCNSYRQMSFNVSDLWCKSPILE
jgi:hypothetical protein